MSKEGRKFLLEKSKELLRSQLDSYRSTHIKGGTLLGFTTLFMSLIVAVINELSKEQLYIIPFLLFSTSLAIINLLDVMTSRPLKGGMSSDTTKGYLNEDKKTIELYEASSNLKSFEQNEEVIDKVVITFLRAIKWIKISLVFTILIVLIGLFYPKEAKETIKIEKNVVMGKDKKPANDTLPEVSNSTLRIIKDANIQKPDEVHKEPNISELKKKFK